jgi:hypothetical protein
MSESDSSKATIIVDAAVDKSIGSDTSKEIKKLIVLAILVNSRNEDGVMVPHRGAIRATAKKFEVSKHVASRIILRMRSNYHDEGMQTYTASPKKKPGKQANKNCKEVADAIARLPYHHSAVGWRQYRGR